MSTELPKDAPQADKKQSSTMKKLLDPSSSLLTFILVLVMLVILFTLIIILLISTAWYLKSGKNVLYFNEFLEYSKWIFSGLITAFGAWIGAGAAYFFGKENLAESSRSTEEALRIQKGLTKQDRIKDLALTIMNKGFTFTLEQKVEEVKVALEKHPDYWWVPVLDNEEKAVLQDVIHARVFWHPKFDGVTLLSKVLEDISKEVKHKERDDSQPAQKEGQSNEPDMSKLHGPSFFIKAALDDKIADVSRSMEKAGAVIGIVVDDRGKPSYCFTKQNLLTAEQA